MPLPQGFTLDRSQEPVAPPLPPANPRRSALPDGFTLDAPVAPAAESIQPPTPVPAKPASLPPGFQLDAAPTVAAKPTKPTGLLSELGAGIERGSAQPGAGSGSQLAELTVGIGDPAQFFAEQAARQKRIMMAPQSADAETSTLSWLAARGGEMVSPVLEAGAGMLAGSPAGPVGAVAGAGVVSGLQDFATSYFSYLASKGIDVTDPNALLQVWTGTDGRRAEALSYAAKRGGVTGLLSAATGAVAGKVAGSLFRSVEPVVGDLGSQLPKVLPRTLGQKVGLGATQVGVGAVGGAATEAGAELASEGQIDPNRVGQTAVLSALGGAIPEVTAPVVGKAVKTALHGVIAFDPNGIPRVRKTLDQVYANAINENDPQVKGAAELIRHLEEGIFNNEQPRVDPVKLAQVINDFYKDTPIKDVPQAARDLLAKVDAHIQESLLNPKTRPLGKSVLQQSLARYLVSARQVAQPGPPPQSMVNPLIVQSDGFAKRVDLADGLDEQQAKTLVVRHVAGEPLTASEAVKVVDWAQTNGYERVAWSDNTTVSHALDFVNEHKAADVRTVDVNFGKRETLNSSDFKESPFLKNELPIDPFQHESGGDIASYGPANIPSFNQRGTARWKPGELAPVMERMKKAVERIVSEFAISKPIQFHVHDTNLAIGQYGRSRAEAAHYELHVWPHSHASIPGVWSTVIHELGHIVYWNKFSTATTQTKLRILWEYATYHNRLLDAQMRGANARELSLLRATTTDVTGMNFNSRYRQGRDAIGMQGVNGPATGHGTYWASFSEWFAQQVARWGTTSEKPLGVVNHFFEGLYKELYKVLTRLYRNAGLQLDATRVMQDWLDEYLRTAPVSAFATAYQRVLAESTARNRVALAAIGAGAVDAGPATPETLAFRQSHNALFSGNANIPGWTRGAVDLAKRQLFGLAAMADRIGEFTKRALRLDQMAKVNPHIRDLTAFVNKIVHAELIKTQINGPATATVRRFKKLSPTQTDGLNAFLDDYSHERYRSPAEQQAGVHRHPTAAELLAMQQQHGLDANTYSIFEQMVHDYDNALTRIEDLRKAEAGKLPNLVEQAKRLGEIEKAIALQRQRPYMPWMRYGEYNVTVRDANNKLIPFFQAESVRDQAAIAREMAQHYPQPAFSVNQNKMHENTLPLLGMPVMFLQMIKDKLGPHLAVEQRDFIDAMMYEQSPAHSFVHRFQKREGTLGHSTDYLRGYAQYYMHMANHLTRVMFRDELSGHVKAVAEQSKFMGNEGNLRSDIANFMGDHLKNWLDPKADAWKVKAIGAQIYLGFNVKSAFVNLTSILTGAYPYLASAFGDLPALNTMRKHILRRGTYLTAPKLEQGMTFTSRILNELYKESVISESYASEIAAVAEGRNLIDRAGSRVAGRTVGGYSSRGAKWMLEKSMSLFQYTEQINRRNTAAAAADLAMGNPGAHAVNEAILTYPKMYERLIGEGWTPTEAGAVVTARNAVELTQGIYSRWSRPKIFRGKLGAIFQFQSFKQNTLFHLWNYPGSALRQLLVFGFLGGAVAEPGAADLIDAIKVLADRLFGKDFDLEREARKAIMEYTDGQVDPDWLLHGVSSKGFGLPAIADLLGDHVFSGTRIPFPTFDLSASMGLGQISPIQFAPLFSSSADPNTAIAGATQQAAGATFGLIFPFYKMLTDPQNSGRYAQQLIPHALTNLWRAYRGYEAQGVVAADGSKTVKFDPRDTEQMAEILGLAFGAQSRRLTKAWEVSRDVAEIDKFWTVRRNALLSQYSEAIRTGAKDEIASITQAIHNFNLILPTELKRSKRITSDVIRSSIKQRLGAVARKDAGTSANKSQAALLARVKAQYPDSNPVSAQTVK